MATNNNINIKNSGLVYCDAGSAYNAISLPITPTNAGTNAVSYTVYTVICTGTTASGAFQNVASVGSAAQVLMSNGTSSLPSFQASPTTATGYTLRLCNIQSSPSASTTYYVPHGANITNTDSTLAAAKIIFPVAGTVTACYGDFYIAGTLASTENVSLYLRINDTTDTAITTTLQTTSISNPFNNSGLSISVSAGDNITLKLVTPAWVTSPTSVMVTYTVLVT